MQTQLPTLRSDPPPQAPRASLEKAAAELGGGEGGRRSTARREGHVSSARHHTRLIGAGTQHGQSTSCGAARKRAPAERTSGAPDLSRDEPERARTRRPGGGGRDGRPLSRLASAMVRPLRRRSSSELLAVRTLMGPPRAKCAPSSFVLRACLQPVRWRARKWSFAAASSSLRDLVARTRQGHEQA
jgi:hypothetical protein